jgi:hypothetical protein
MRLQITITVQYGEIAETPVFESDCVPPESVSSTLAIAEQTALATLAATYAGPASLREYLGPTLLATIHSKGQIQEHGQQPPRRWKASLQKACARLKRRLSSRSSFRPARRVGAVSLSS